MLMIIGLYHWLNDTFMTMPAIFNMSLRGGFLLSPPTLAPYASAVSNPLLSGRLLRQKNKSASQRHYFEGRKNSMKSNQVQAEDGSGVSSKN